MKRTHPERIALIVGKGHLAPADGYAEERLRERKYAIGDILSAELRKSRSPGYNRLAHQLGALVAENVEEFTGLNAHQVLKRLQLESGVACEEIAIKVEGYGMMMHRTPLSLSFDSMDEGEFREAINGLSRWISDNYWKGLDEVQVLDMAALMP